MMKSSSRVLLLVEDDPADALRFTELVGGPDHDRYRVVHAPSIAAALEQLRRADASIDVVVLDLNLPDGRGVAAVNAVRARAGQTPIVVLTGSDDDVLAHACLDAGAQDYLSKSEVGTHNLSRAIGYAITRVREAQVRELQSLLDGYRALSSASQTTTVTAALAGSGAIAVRQPELHAELIAAYHALLTPSLRGRGESFDVGREAAARFVTRLGDAGGGPRDLLDVHTSALDRAIASDDDQNRARAVILEARLIALQMMGMLVDYYRVGQRRRSVEGARS